MATTTKLQLDRAQVLAAMFRVTRSAKRNRDAASSCYASGAYQFATANRRKNERLYTLKDRGIVTAFRNGWIHAMGRTGSLTVYRGDGYCFHSLLRPKGIDLDVIGDDTSLWVEAKPVDPRAMRLRDAEEILSALSSDTEGFERHGFRHPTPSWDVEAPYWDFGGHA